MSKKVKALTSKPYCKPFSGNKELMMDPDIRLYEIEGGDKTEEGQEVEILIMHDKILMETMQNLVKRKFPYIDTSN